MRRERVENLCLSLEEVAALVSVVAVVLLAPDPHPAAAASFPVLESAGRKLAAASGGDWEKVKNWVALSLSVTSPEEARRRIEEEMG